MNRGHRGDRIRATHADPRHVGTPCLNTSADASDIAEALLRACRRRYGATVQLRQLARLSAGASSRSWRFVLEGMAAPDAASIAAVLQTFAGGQQYPGALDKLTQARVQSIVAQSGVPVPPVLFILEAADELGEGFATRWVDGETLGQRVVGDAQLENARARLTAQCATALASIHRMALDALPRLPERGARASLQLLAETHRSFGAEVPIFELALRWLSERLPAEVPGRLVHGDFRTGNLMVTREGLAAVLDWEMAHLGDPMEDLGWLCVNAWRFGRIELAAGGFGSREALFREYERASGQRVDPAAVRFWQVYGTLQWGVMCQWFAAQYTAGSVRELERVAIGRRVSEVQQDLMDLLRGRD